MYGLAEIVIFGFLKPLSLQQKLNRLPPQNRRSCPLQVTFHLTLRFLIIDFGGDIIKPALDFNPAYC